MKYMFPCALEVQGLPNSHIISCSVSVSRNNVLKKARIEVVGAVPPSNTTISFVGVELFRGKIQSLQKLPCGRVQAEYTSEIKEITRDSLVLVPYGYIVRQLSPAMVKNLNDLIYERITNPLLVRIRPIPEETDLHAGEYQFIHPQANNIRWRISVFHFAVDKERALQPSTWIAMASVSVPEHVLNEWFGQMLDDEVAIGMFATVKETVDYGSNWYIAGFAVKHERITASKIYVHNTVYTSTNLAVFKRRLITAKDVLEALGIYASNQLQPVYKPVFVEAYSTGLEVVRNLCKNITATISEDGTLVIREVQEVTREYELQENVLFSYSLPERKAVNVVVEYEYSPSASVSRRKRTTLYQVAGAVDTVKVRSEEVDFNEVAIKTIKQVQQDVQDTGSVRSILLPDLQIYEKVRINNNIYRVVSFTHSISRQGAFTDMQIIPEV